MKKTMTCIECPVGCSLEISFSNNSLTDIQGNKCARGAEYAEKELFAPLRSLTCLMRVEGSEAVLSVRSTGLIPAEQILSCVKTIYKTRAPSDTKEGNILIFNICGTGINIIATSSVQ